MGYRKLRRRSSHRRAMLRNLVTSLLNTERITTTETRAKEIKRIADKMITLGKKGDLHARRQALAYLTDEGVVYKVFGQLAERYGDRPGGYTRITKAGFRRGDGAPLVVLELVQ
ncbi:MAG: 50S ribosomal protein L17 [Syntrophomonadaceae bacterium]|nr:50S ribosomal protein L17 [Syntrophomonadaceae bacterium]